MNKKSIDERLQDLKPRVDLNTQSPTVDLNPKTVTTIHVEATEKQLQHLISHMRMLRIKFKL